MPERNDLVELYQRYEASLTALLQVPGTLSKSLDSARRAHETAQQNADNSYKAEINRLATLRRSAQDRYSRAGARLTEHGNPIPAQVRAVATDDGSAKALRSAVAAHTTAAADVDTAIGQAAVDAARRKAEAARAAAKKASSGQQAVSALQKRQEALRRQREAEDKRRQEEARLAAESAAHRRRIVLISGISGGGLLAVAVVVIAVVATNH
ncbi:hypothetical protein ACFOYW_18420 [Gryllotalpicola reticulitermitis]|uniref:Uncharacterized protein n=1 Tax=Gryllotalpicola reticulitermitis TaxID=1184153 RepID=A0ABV8QDD5_9MICO